MKVLMKFFSIEKMQICEMFVNQQSRWHHCLHSFTFFFQTSFECMLTLSLGFFINISYKNLFWLISKYCPLANFYTLFIVRLLYVSLDTSKRTQGRWLSKRKCSTNIRKTHFYNWIHQFDIWSIRYMIKYKTLSFSFFETFFQMKFVPIRGKIDSIEG